MYYDNIIDKGPVVYTNHELIEGEVKALCLRLHAYGDEDRIYEAQAIDKALAAAGVLSVFPYYDVWGWGNDKTLELFDVILTGIIKKYSLDPAIPFVIFGEGVGGTVALNYVRHGAPLEIKACIAVCPVTDMQKHAALRDDMDAVLFYAFRHGALPFDEALAAVDPARHIEEMPDGVKYLIVTAGKRDEKIYSHKHDRGIRPEEQYLCYIEQMKARGLDVRTEELDIAFSPMPLDAQTRCAELIAELIK